jgi:hypothetical protein
VEGSLSRRRAIVTPTYPLDEMASATPSLATNASALDRQWPALS